MSKQPTQLGFAFAEQQGDHPLLTHCDKCHQAYPRGFACWNCGMRTRHRRRMAAIKSRRCSTPGCGKPRIADTYCGPIHQRDQAREYRPVLLSALHSVDLGKWKTRERDHRDFVNEIALVDKLLGDLMCD